MGRNNIKKLENLESVADTLTQLWISYNQIEKLSGIEKLKKLKVLYMSNNKVDKWSEFERLVSISLDYILKHCLERTSRARGFVIYRKSIREECWR